MSYQQYKTPCVTLCVTGKTVCTAITIARWDWFEQWQDERIMKRGEDYNSIKTAIKRRMWEQVLSVYPQLDDKVRLGVGSKYTQCTVWKHWLAVYSQLDVKVACISLRY